MENFSLEKYNTGNYDVVTRGGHSVRILCTDKDDVDGQSIVALVRCGSYDEELEDYAEEVVEYTPDGIFLENKEHSLYDLQMEKSNKK